MACKVGQFDVVELMINDQFKTFSINLNAQHVNGMTPFDLALSTVIRYSVGLGNGVHYECGSAIIWQLDDMIAVKKTLLSLHFSMVCAEPSLTKVNHAFKLR